MIDVRTGRKAPSWREASLRRLGLAKPKRRKQRIAPVEPLEPEPPVIEENDRGT